MNEKKREASPKRIGSILFYQRINESLCTIPPIHLHLIFEISSLKNPVHRTGFFVYFELDFYCLCSLQKSGWK